MEILSHYRFMLFELLTLGSLLYALLRGGAPERIAGLMLTGAWLLSIAASAHAHYAEHFERDIFLIDVALFFGLYGLSLVSTRYWPLWMCGMQGVDVLSHIVALLEPLQAYGYAIMIQFWGYPIQILLIVATWRHRQRLKRQGTDPAWVMSGR